MNIKENIKNALKLVAKAVLTSKIFIIIIAAIIIFIVFFPSIIYYITVDDGTYKEEDWKSTPYAASAYTKSATISKNGIHTSTSAQEVWDKAVSEGNNIQEYLNSPDQLEQLMNAEIVTQYPKISNGNNNGDVNLDGIIEFERHFTNGTTKKLTYIDTDTFNNMVTSGDKNILNYFTLDGNENVIVGIVDENDEELVFDDNKADISLYSGTLTDSDKVGDGHYNKKSYLVNTQTINYKQIAADYTMPYDLLWAFVVINEDIDFALELANLALKSEITISIYDNVKTTENRDNYMYKRQTRIDTYAQVRPQENYNITGYETERYWVGEMMDKYDSRYQPDYGTSDEYNIVYKTTEKKDTLIVELTHANTWNVKVDKEVTFQAEKVDSQNINKVEKDDTEFIGIEGNPFVLINEEANSNEKAKGFAEEVKKYIEQKIKNEENNNSNNVSTTNNTNMSSDTNTSSNTQDNKEVKVNITKVECSYYERIIDSSVESTSITKSQNYVTGAVAITPKDDINSAEPNFVTIFNDVNHSKASGITIEIDSWLFEILESNDSTKNMVDLVKYLLYKATNVDYGVTEFNYDEMVKRKYINATGEIKGNSIQEKVWFMLKELGYSDIAAAGAMGNFHYESGSFNPSMIEAGYDENNGGIGICQWTNSGRGSEGRNTNLKRYAQSKGKDWRDEDIQVSFLRAELGGGGDASSYATVQLLDRREYYNNQYAYKDGWLNATSVENSTQGFCYSFERPNANAAAKSMSQRIAYAQEYLNRYSGVTVPENIETELTGDNKDTMERMIAEAKRIANDDRYQYSQGLRESEFYYDCSSFVSRLYLQYFNISRLDYGNAGRGTDNIRAKGESNYKEVDRNQLRAGDILWVDGHVALYIGNGQTAEAYNDQKGIVITDAKPTTRFTKAFRIIE